MRGERDGGREREGERERAGKEGPVVGTMCASSQRNETYRVALEQSLDEVTAVLLHLPGEVELAVDNVLKHRHLRGVVPCTSHKHG